MVKESISGISSEWIDYLSSKNDNLKSGLGNTLYARSVNSKKIHGD